MKLYNFLSIILFAIFSQVKSLYFFMNRNEERCFYDEFYDNLVVMLRYEVMDKFSSIHSKF